MSGTRLRPRRRALLLTPLAALLLAACAQPRLRPEAAAFWQGRLALRVEATPPQAFFADFELTGDARQGALLLTGPLGQTLAQLDWSPAGATLRDGRNSREFGSLDALAAQATGTPIPVAALFEWLAGRPAAADGWQADLSQLAEGRLSARRLAPEPAAELKLVLEPPSR